MATLEGQIIADTYTLLLKMASGGVASGLVKVQDGDATDSALSIGTVSVAIDSGDKFYLDGGTHTYINESGADIMDFFVGGVHLLSLDDANSEVVINEGSADVNFRVEGNGDANLLFCDAGSDRVGIGINAPTSLLMLTSSDTGTAYSAGSATGQLANGTTLQIYNAGSATNDFSQILFTHAGGMLSRIVSTDQGGGDSNLSFVVEDGGTPHEVMRILETGFIGIGTAAPGALLTLHGTSTTDYDDTQTDGQKGVGTTLQLHNTGTGTNDFNQILFTHENGMISRIVSLERGSGDSALAFVVENSNTPNEVMRIIDSGNVGIGLTDPDSALEILNTSTQLKLSYDATDFCTFTVDTNHDITITPSSTGQIKLKPTTDSVDFFQVLDADAGTPILNVDSTNERVGIGTATPGVLLDIVGGDIRLEDTQSIRWVDSGGNAYTYIKNDGLDLDFYTNNTVKMSILQGGNVGIGVTAPATKLYVTDNVAGGSVVTFANSHDTVVDNDNILHLKFTADNDVTEGNFILFADNNTAEMGVIKATGAGTMADAYSSDYRRKENIVPISKGLKEINLLNPIEFNFKQMSNRKPYSTAQGFLAHEVQEAGLGFAVQREKDGMKIDNDKTSPTYGESVPNYQLLCLKDLIPAMVKAIQELSAKVTALENA